MFCRVFFYMFVDAYAAKFMLAICYAVGFGCEANGAFRGLEGDLRCCFFYVGYRLWLSLCCGWLGC